MPFSPITHPEIFDQVIAAADLSTRLVLAATCWRLCRLIAPYNHLVLRCLDEGVIDVRAAPTWKLERATDNKPDYDAKFAQWDQGTLDDDGVLPEFPPMAYTSEVKRIASSKFGQPQPLGPVTARRAALLANTRIVDIVGPIDDPWLFLCMENLRTVRLCTVHDQSNFIKRPVLMQGRIVTPLESQFPMDLTEHSVMFGESIVRHVESGLDLPFAVQSHTTVLVFTPLKAEWKRAVNPDLNLKYIATFDKSPSVVAYWKAIYPHAASTAAVIWIGLLHRIGPRQDYDKVDEPPRKWVLVGLHDMGPGVFFPIGPDTNSPVAPNLEAELRAAAGREVRLEFLTIDEYNSKHPFDLGHWPAPGVKEDYRQWDCHSETEST